MSFSNPKRRPDKWSWIALAAAVTFLLFVWCVCGRFASPDTAKNLLTTSGFSNIELVSKDPYFASLRGCDKRDLTIFTFKATNPAKKEVIVKVCQGWPLKGATIRSL